MHASAAALPNDAPIGVFDSGVGGLSVLRHIRALLPQENLIYFADTGFAPYGDKPEAVVVARTLQAADFLVERGAKALVIACNTATVAAVKQVRAHYPLLPIVGVEPGLKPAAALTRSGKVGVLATRSTLGGDKFLQLRDQLIAAGNTEFLLQACVGLVDKIELGELDNESTVALLERYVQPLLAQGADTLVLGCTHYPFVRGVIEAIVQRNGMGPVALVDTGDAVARQLSRLLLAASLQRDAGPSPTLAAYTTAGAAALARGFSTLLGLHPEVQEVRFPAPVIAVEEKTHQTAHLDLPVGE